MGKLGEDRTLIPDTLLSYDVSGAARGLSVRVAQLIYGRSDAPPDGRPPYIRRPGVVWVGQSVLLLPGRLARELADTLEAMGARVTMARVQIQRQEVEALKRGQRRRGRPIAC